MSKVIESYRDGQDDCYQEGCDDCQLMIRAGYGRSGCCYHKLEERHRKYKVALEEISQTFMELGIVSVDEMMAWGIERGDIARKALKK